MKSKVKHMLAIALLAGTSSSMAATLASYEFNNSDPGNNTTNTVDFTSSDTDINSTAGTFGSGAGFNLNTTVVMTGFTSDGLGLSDGTGDDLAGAISAEDYFTFTMTAASGFTLNLENLNLDVGRSIRGAQDFYVFSDVDGFVAGQQIDSVLNIGEGTTNLDVDLSDSKYSGLSFIEFRIYVDDRANNSTSSSATFVDNVVLTGVAVPEPSSAALLGLGGLALILRRRK
ncbi:PEP-CTERM sorting domain-containing protein [Oceaniferula spumae]